MARLMAPERPGCLRHSSGAVLLVLLAELSACIGKLLLVNRLYQILVHSRKAACLLVLVEGFCRHGDDGDALRIVSLQGSDGAGCRKAVHHGHHQIHQDKRIDPLRRLAELLDSLVPIPRLFDGCARFLQVELGNFHVDLVVLGNEDVHAL